MSALGLADLSAGRSCRDPGGGPPLVHPGFLRDAGERRTAAAIAGVAGYLASLVGHPRRDYDPDVPVEIAGDRRFGRALVTVCMDWYRWRGRGFAEALPGPVADGLARAGVETSSALRLRLFDLANAEYAGFVPAARRGEALGRLAAALGLGADAVDALDAALTLDAEEEAVLEATAFPAFGRRDRRRVQPRHPGGAAPPCRADHIRHPRPGRRARAAAVRRFAGSASTATWSRT
ncbi:MAG: hypothetical protein U0531_09530 [Dehalococcoidia bacterium]